MNIKKLTICFIIKWHKVRAFRVTYTKRIPQISRIIQISKRVFVLAYIFLKQICITMRSRTKENKTGKYGHASSQTRDKKQQHDSRVHGDQRIKKQRNNKSKYRINNRCFTYYTLILFRCIIRFSARGISIDIRRFAALANIQQRIKFLCGEISCNRVGYKKKWHQHRREDNTHQAHTIKQQHVNQTALSKNNSKRTCEIAFQENSFNVVKSFFRCSVTIHSFVRAITHKQRPYLNLHYIIKPLLFSRFLLRNCHE